MFSKYGDFRKKFLKNLASLLHFFQKDLIGTELFE
jgi:hypothetical protein